MTTPLTVGSLFSGIGGLELGLERTGGFRVIWQCENDAYASAVLKKHWKNTPNLGDITKVDWNEVEKPDLICGGFPCQDISVAGKGKGLGGERSGLWREYAKALRALRPRYALVENVSALSFRGLLAILGDLAEIGYDAEWFVVRASDVGAPHRRERLFIVAYPDKFGRNGSGDRAENGKSEKNDINGERRKFEFDALLPGDAKVADDFCNRIQGRIEKKICWFPEFQRFANVRRVEELRGRTDIPEPLIRRTRDGFPNYMDRIKCLGNAVVPQVAQVIGLAILEVNARG